MLLREPFYRRSSPCLSRWSGVVLDPKPPVRAEFPDGALEVENRCLLAGDARFITSAVYLGAVAQLIERLVRNEEVVGLIPIRSTKVGNS
jgi:hypothetical protein